MIVRDDADPIVRFVELGFKVYAPAPPYHWWEVRERYTVSVEHKRLGLEYEAEAPTIRQAWRQLIEQIKAEHEWFREVFDKGFNGALIYEEEEGDDQDTDHDGG